MIYGNEILSEMIEDIVYSRMRTFSFNLEIDCRLVKAREVHKGTVQCCELYECKSLTQMSHCLDTG